MAITGVGNYVKIAASSVWTGLGGIAFGRRESASSSEMSYCSVFAQYKETLSYDIERSGIVIEQDQSSKKLYLGFPNVTQFYINGYKGFTGDMKVVDYITQNGYVHYATYMFKNGVWIR